MNILINMCANIVFLDSDSNELAKSADLPTYISRLRNSVNRSSKFGWFLTFPRSGVLTRSELLLVLKKLFSIECALIAQEPHKDQGLHLHAQFRLKTPLTKTTVLTALQKAYPDASHRIHLRPVPKNDWRHTIMYVIAPDKDKDCDSTPLFYNMVNPLEKRLTPEERDCRFDAKINAFLLAETRTPEYLAAVARQDLMQSIHASAYAAHKQKRIDEKARIIKYGSIFSEPF